MKIQNRPRARDGIVEASQKMVSILGSLAEGISEVRTIIDPTTAESATR